MVDWATVALALITGTLSLLSAMLLSRWLPDRPVPRAGRAGEEVEPTSLLFRDRRLIDATGPARSLLDTLPGSCDWTRIWMWLAQRFDQPQRILDMAAADGVSTVSVGTGGAAALSLRAHDLGEGVVRLDIVDPTRQDAAVSVNARSLAAMEDELVVLRECVDHAPVLIWQEDKSGCVSWANGAYLREIEQQYPQDVQWPLPRLIELPSDAVAVRRIQIQHDDQPRWFDCHLQEADGHRTIFAIPADNAAKAERSLRAFVQTLTKTFADLHIGLAIFDRDRRLQLFNPALIDLTGLPTAFLTARPTLHALLDALRELRIIPEPKDYAAWRQTLATLEAEAAAGHHVESWTLPDGRTYRVTGRPHPDGAIAFLFEDITTEIAMTRRFKAELSLGAEVLDALESAVVIFDADGTVLTTNRSFEALWGRSAARSLRAFEELWRNAAEDSPGYQTLRAALSLGALDGRRSGAMAGPDQGLLSWRVRMLSGGRRMVQFKRTVGGDAVRSDGAEPLPHAESALGAA